MTNTSKKLSSYMHYVVFSLITAVAVISFTGQVYAQQQQLTPAEINQRVDELITKLTLRQKIKLIGGVDGMFTYAMPQIGLPRLKMSDASMGVRVWGPSIAYAAGIGLAASWDPALAYKVGKSIGRDARARGVNFVLGPGVNIYRLPVDGRNFEFLGEDPYLGSRVAVPYIDGMQSENVSATVKHYDANNSEYNRGNENEIISHRTLREIYLPIFEAAVKQAHAGAIMNSYNLVNGEHSTQNPWLNITVLRKDWGFRGILMSDWGATHSVIPAANAGLDLEMPSARYMNAENLLPAIKDGKVSVATIDEKVHHILYDAVRFGWLNHDQYNLNISRYSRKSLAVALQSAKECMVLLKNQGNILPLDMSQVHTIALIGPDAYPTPNSAGGSGHVTAIAPVSFLQGLSESFPHTKILWDWGVRSLNKLIGPEAFGSPLGTGFSTDAAGNHPGLTQEDFDSRTFAGQPIQTHVVRGAYFWHSSRIMPLSPNVVAVRWAGYYTAKTSGPQEFIVGSIGRDSYQLYVNNKMVLEGLPARGEPQSIDIDMQQGQSVPVRLDYLPESARIQAGFNALPAADLIRPNVKSLARRANVVILSVGFSPETEGEGHDRTYGLPPGQVQMIKEVSAVNPHTIVVLTSGGAVATESWLNRVPAFLATWYTGSEGGLALADVLSGRYDPSGRLPITWWKTIQENPAYHNYWSAPGSNDVTYREGVFLGYRAYGHDGQPAPLFPFGYGLSYTTFAYSNLSVSPTTASPNGPITVSFDVKNTGEREGSEPAEVYVSDPSAKVPRPEIELKGFERVTLEPGQTRHVTVTLDKRSLAYWDAAIHNWKVDPGTFVVSVGSSSMNLPLKEKFTVR
ncbi:MAG: glycoside hydrolase family 3 C-terminal domain-containing protein [Acidobacteria bacterium]|nr:glycoside hydrolase family 3 C-terminal domain-containing protein [Acidobacteriota bacterium]